MDNERPNEPTTWSRRLEEPGALPGLTDREGAWDKLYDRLKEAETPRRRRTMIWFWAAAACILLIVIPAVILLKDGHHSSRPDPQKMPVAVNPRSQSNHTAVDPVGQPNHTVANPGSRPGQMAVNPKQRRPGSSDSAAQGPSTSSRLTLSGASRPVHPNRTSHQVPVTHPSPIPNLASNTHPTPPVRSASMPDSPAHRPGLNKPLAQPKDSLTLVFARPDLSRPPLTAAAASEPPKKELRVIHINELQPSQPTPSMAIGPREKPGGLHIALTPQETFRPSITYDGSENHTIFTQNESLIRWPKANH